jgi:N-acetylglutamate synthase-like GNAT family acetyltransferase
MVGFLFNFPLKLPHAFQNANATVQLSMNRQTLHIRRATVDDRAALKTLWTSMRLPVDKLEKRLTEFQVAESSGGEVAGAIGIQFSRQHALLHSEGYSDFSIADATRQLFWERIQILAANHGVFRLWTLERSPFWISFGFQPPDPGTLARLPKEWENEFDRGWLTFQHKNEDVINAAFEKHFVGFMDSEKKKTDAVSEKTRTFNTAITIAGFGIFFICVAFLIFWLIHHPITPP